MKLVDKLKAAEAISTILERARRCQRAARMAANTTPQYDPELTLPPAFGSIPAEYRMFKGRYLLPVLATGAWMPEEHC